MSHKPCHFAVQALWFLSPTLLEHSQVVKGNVFFVMAGSIILRHDLVKKITIVCLYIMINVG